MMKQLKTMVVLSLIYLLVGPLLFWIEQKTMVGLNLAEACVQIVCIATAFWFFTLFELQTTAKKRAERPQSLVGIFMAFKGVRFLLASVAMLCYGVLSDEYILAFGINLIVFYLVTMIFTTICYVRDEKKNNEAKHRL